VSFSFFLFFISCEGGEESEKKETERAKEKKKKEESRSRSFPPLLFSTSRLFFLAQLEGEKPQLIHNGRPSPHPPPKKNNRIKKI
jgi:hypothetical protein